MPPAKKRKLALPATVGRKRQYLMDNFNELPDERIDLKNGHVLLQFVTHDNSIAKTVKAITEKLPGEILQGHVQSLLNKDKKLYNVSREPVREKYETFCKQVFDRAPSKTKRSAEPDLPECLNQEQPEGEPDTCDVEPSLNTSIFMSPQLRTSDSSIEKRLPKTPGSSTSLRLSPFSSVRSSGRLQGTFTPRKQKLKRRLDFAQQTKIASQKKYKAQVTKLRCEINQQNRHQVKYLHQEINRKKMSLVKKDQKIKSLRLQFSKTALGKELTATKMKLKNAKRKCKTCTKRNKPQDSSYDADIQKLTDELSVKNATIQELENEKLYLEETVDSLKSDASNLHKPGKTYSLEMRQSVYDCIVNNVPTKNIPILIEKFAMRFGIHLDHVPHRSTVETMARELGVVSDFQAAEMIIENKDLTLGFDATTQEGVHVNSIHVTSPSSCQVIGIDQLAGGTAEDYSLHVDESIDRITNVYCHFYSTDFSETRKKILKNISNTMTDRAAVNHATIQQLELSWRKSINELNCHLHPLDTIASSMRSTLKALEPKDLGKKLWGTESISHQIVLAVNKLRYKDGRGDPKGFTTCLENANLPKGLIPRYRGNRLHIMFYICAQLHCHRNFFKTFFDEGTVTCGGLQGCLQQDFLNPCAVVEIQTLGLLGKLLSGPWMTKFYTSSSSSVTHVDGICVVKDVVGVLENFSDAPLNTLTTTTDFFGNKLEASDTVLVSLQQDPVNVQQFSSMMAACLKTAVEVLKRQYQRYFDTDLTDKLRMETESARCHNIDAEEIMGMFSAAHNRAPNATMCYLSSRIRAQKNKVANYIDSLSADKRERIVILAVKLGRKQRQHKRKQHEVLKTEISKRFAKKVQKKKCVERNKLEKTLKNCDINSLDIRLQPDFKDIEPAVLDVVDDILSGKVVGRRITHIWYDENSQQKSVYNGKIEKLLKRNRGTYRIGYWKESAFETYDKDAEDYDLSKFSIAVDLICEDLFMS